MLLIFICFALCVFILRVSESTMSLADDKEAGAFGPAVREQKIKNLTKYPLYRPPGWHIVVTSRLSHCQKRFIYMHVSLAEFVWTKYYEYFLWETFSRFAHITHVHVPVVYNLSKNYNCYKIIIHIFGFFFTNDQLCFYLQLSICINMLSFYIFLHINNSYAIDIYKIII